MRQGGFGSRSSGGAAGLMIVAAALLVGSCGGDDDEAGPGPNPPGNRAPVFTSPATATVQEGNRPVLTATATDADGNPLTFSISGGADAADFQITAAGALTFAATPDFEAPADADGDNVYQVTLAVSDGTVTTTQAFTVTVTNSNGTGFVVRRVGTGFSQPLYVAPVPDNSGRVFVVQKGGLIRILNPATGAIAGQPFIDLRNQVSTDGERGLLGFATAPDFTTSGVVYVYLTNPAGNIELRRYTAPATSRDQADLTTGQLLLTIPHPGANNHNGGWIGFGPDGFLYVAVGDGGGSGDPNNNAQNANVLLGKILRIDVSRDDFPADAQRNYGIPAANPFASGTNGRPEIFALGLRNPFRNSFDSVTGQLLVADVGQNAVEEVNLLPTSPTSALNLAWPIKEGTAPFRNDGVIVGDIPPVTQYSHGNGPREGGSITGGYVYRGPVEALQGLYVFGDFVSGNLWTIPLARLTPGVTRPASEFTVRTTDFQPNAGSIGNVASFGVDQAQNLYIVDFDGEIFRVEAGG